MATQWARASACSYDTDLVCPELTKDLRLNDNMLQVEIIKDKQFEHVNPNRLFESQL